MTDDVRADARRLLQKHSDKADLSLDAPTSLDDIRERLARCTQGCRCDDGDHENAVHDLASSDVPVLLAAFEDALAELDQEQDRALRLAIRAAGCEKAETERDAALATLARIQAVAADVDQDGGHSGPSLARHILNIIGGEA